MRHDTERSWLSDHASLETRPISTHLARLHRCYVHLEWTFLYRLTRVLDGHDVQTRFDWFVDTRVVVVDFGQSVLFRRSARTHDHDSWLTVTSSSSLCEYIELCILADTNTFGLDTATSGVALLGVRS